jgi:hypothetical protein
MLMKPFPSRIVATHRSARAVRDAACFAPATCRM